MVAGSPVPAVGVGPQEQVAAADRRQAVVAGLQLRGVVAEVEVHPMAVVEG